MAYTCTVDGCGFTSRKYPRSAGIRAVQTHLEDEHPGLYAEYLRLREQERQERGFFDRLINGSNVDINDVEAPTEGEGGAA